MCHSCMEYWGLLSLGFWWIKSFKFQWATHFYPFVDVLTRHTRASVRCGRITHSHNNTTQKMNVIEFVKCCTLPLTWPLWFFIHSLATQSRHTGQNVWSLITFLWNCLPLPSLCWCNQEFLKGMEFFFTNK